MHKQLGDLPTGEWFDIGGSLVMWIVTDCPATYDGYTICVQASTGKAVALNNSTRVYPRARPY